MAEQGFAEAQVTPWFGIVVPAGTPQPIVDRISARRWRPRSPRRRCAKSSTWPVARRKARRLREFADIIKSDIALWAKVVKDAGIPAD